jgi:hypothetical protein
MRSIMMHILILAALTGACDPEHKGACEWFLMPNDVKVSTVDDGYVPVCARNLGVNKEDCRLQTTLKFAEKAYRRRFRYTDLKVKDFGLPRTIDSIKFCE